MKRIILFSSLFALFTLHAADMSGDFDTWLGYIAGINADGERSTVQGAGAGGEATGLIRTDLIGAAAGAYSSHLTDCVGIGYRALRNAGDMREVVAIGSGAFTNRTGLTRATYINGQFVAYGQNNTFAVKANRNTPDTNAPIYYADGVLNLNADEIRFNGATASTGGTTGSTSAPSLAGFDLYVDCVNGDDSNAGTTPGTAKRTIDGAYAAVTNHDMTICLMPGEYASPDGACGGYDTNEYPMRFHLIGAYGAENTVINGEGQRGYWGCNYLFSSVEGCTLRGFTSAKVNRPMFFGVYFYRCRIELDNCEKTIRDSAFYGCILERCTVSGSAVQTQYKPSDAFFYRSDVFDSVIEVSGTNNLCSQYLLSGTYIENCYLSIDSTVAFGDSSSQKSILGNSTAIVDSTVICPSAQTFTVPSAIGCLFGLGDLTNSVPTYATLAGCVCTNAATVAEVVGDGYRPPVTAWRFRYSGYESAAERATRDSMESSVVDALLQNEDLSFSPAATMSLLRIIEDNEAANLPAVANRGTNSIPAGTVLQLPPDPAE